MPFLATNKFYAHFLLYDTVTFFILGQKTKEIFSQKNHFLFSEQTILMGRKGGDSNNPKCFWHILLLRPDVGDFKTWIFWTSQGSPIIPQGSFFQVQTFCLDPFQPSVIYEAGKYRLPVLHCKQENNEFSFSSCNTDTRFRDGLYISHFLETLWLKTHR